MGRGRIVIVLGVAALVASACSERATQAPPRAMAPPHAIGGGPRATADARRAMQLNGDWSMTQQGPGLIGHRRVPLDIRVEGTHVLGWYHPDQGMIDGELRGDVIEGSWKETDGEGTFVWRLSKDGNHFSGVFGGMLHSQSVPEGSTWIGVRR